MKRLTLCLALGLLLAACNEAAPPEAAQPPDPVMQGQQLQYVQGHPHLALLTAVAARPGEPLQVDMPARLVWNEERTQRIYPAFAGRVARIVADVGQPVKPGSVLAQLASPDFGAAQADTAKARIDAALSQKALQRQRELFDAGIVARKDLDQAEADAARAQAEIQRAEARTRLYGGGSGVNQALALTSGIAGLVVERNLTPGQELRPDQMGSGTPPLFVVSDPGSLWVLIDARETEAGTLRPGSSFKLAVPALPGEVFEGKVTAAADAIDPTTRTIKVRGVVANPARKLKAEMLGTARVMRQIGDGVLIPASAVLLRGNQHFVMLQVRPGTFEPRDVAVAYQGPKEAVVTQGLKAGDQVVSDNVLLLTRQYRLAQETSAGKREGAAAK
jgi:cobalt-zinc-cadmium efflux system membrane fusion protein